MSEKEIYNRNKFDETTNNKCGIVIEDNKAYQCPPSKFCNFNYGLCENTECVNYSIKDLDIDIKKFDGSDVERNYIDICKYPISTDGKCGFDNNSTKCPNGQCCAKNGICSDDKDSCL